MLSVWCVVVLQFLLMIPLRHISLIPDADLFVDPSTRGKGYGRQLIEATADAAGKHGCVRLHWTVYNDNDPAARLYDTLAKSEFRQYRMVLPRKP